MKHKIFKIEKKEFLVDKTNSRTGYNATGVVTGYNIYHKGKLIRGGYVVGDKRRSGYAIVPTRYSVKAFIDGFEDGVLETDPSKQNEIYLSQQYAKIKSKSYKQRVDKKLLEVNYRFGWLYAVNKYK